MPLPNRVDITVYLNLTGAEFLPLVTEGDDLLSTESSEPLFVGQGAAGVADETVYLTRNAVQTIYLSRNAVQTLYLARSAVQAVYLSRVVNLTVLM